MRNLEFRERYMSLTRSNRFHIKVRKEIEKACNVTKAVFYNWVQGVTFVPDEFKPTIAAIMKIPQSELFPEVEAN